MLEDSFLINFLIFAAGQAAAWFYLRTGRRSRGLTLMIGGWVLADILLVERFAFQSTGPLFYLALSSLQLWSLFEVVMLVRARRHRRRPDVLAARSAGFRTSFHHYLRGELDVAVEGYRKILKSDPWDVPTVVALATALSRSGAARAARSMCIRAQRLDVDARFADVVEDELRRLGDQGATPALPPTDPARPRAQREKPGPVAATADDDRATRRAPKHSTVVSGSRVPGERAAGRRSERSDGGRSERGRRGRAGGGRPRSS